MIKVSIQAVTRRKGITCRVRFGENGKAVYKYFKTRSAAEGFAKRKKLALSRGSLVADVSEEDAAFLSEAKRRLGEKNKTLRECLESYLRTLPSEDLAFAEARAKYLEHLEASGFCRSHFLVSRCLLKKFSDAGFSETLVGEIRMQDVDEYLKSLTHLSPSTVRNVRRALHAFFSWAVDRGMAESNPVDKTFNPRVYTSKIGILKVPEVSALLTSVEKNPELCPAIVLALFAGLRRSEIFRLQWEQIRTDFIEISETVGKPTNGRGRGRHVDICPALSAFLAPRKKTTGSIVPSEIRWKLGLEQARKDAGLSSWPHNRLRHSFASYHLAFHKNAPSTSIELGHGGSTNMLYQHYRAIVSHEESVAFWALRPTLSRGIGKPNN